MMATSVFIRSNTHYSFCYEIGMYRFRKCRDLVAGIKHIVEASVRILENGFCLIIQPFHQTHQLLYAPLDNHHLIILVSWNMLGVHLPAVSGPPVDRFLTCCTTPIELIGFAPNFRFRTLPIRIMSKLILQFVSQWKMCRKVNGGLSAAASWFRASMLMAAGMVPGTENWGRMNEWMMNTSIIWYAVPRMQMVLRWDHWPPILVILSIAQKKYPRFAAPTVCWTSEGFVGELSEREA